MSELAFTPRAETDLVEIWWFTAERWETEQADVYVGQILSMCQQLASGVLPGRDAGAIQPGLRMQAVGAHVVFYRESNEELLVIRILYQRKDVSRHFKGD